MTGASAAIVSLRVGATPQRAFELFTREIGVWWRPNPLFTLTPRGDGVLRFEPGPNGRLVTTLPNGKEFVIGEISVWRPGECLVLSWRQVTFAPDQVTEVEVSFEPVGAETRITVAHRGWDDIPQEHASRHGFPLALFLQRQAGHWLMLLRALAERVAEP